MTASKDRVQSVVFAHQILQELAAAGRAVPLAYLAKSLDMTPPRVLRHLATLVDLQLVVREEPEPVYRLGAELLRLSEKAQHQQDVVRIAHPHLARLKDLTGQAVFLVRPREREAVIWASFQSDDTPYLVMPPGMSFSLDGTSTGRVLIAFSDIEYRIENGSRTSPHYRPDPIADARTMKARLTEIRERGYDFYGTDTNEQGLYSFAAPILDHNGTAVAAIGLIGFTNSFHQRGDAIRNALLDCSAAVSAEMGYAKPATA